MLNNLSEQYYEDWTVVKTPTGFRGRWGECQIYDFEAVETHYYLEEPKNKPKGPTQKGRGGKIKKW